jgi:predicted Fe-Mo cluster-binding NifX family protein
MRRAVACATGIAGNPKSSFPGRTDIMQICIPVVEDCGLDSRVSAHFGSAPGFMIVDTESRACRVIGNSNEHHAHGMCQPLAVLAGEPVDGIVVGGIGMGALMKLQAAGITVFRSDYPTVAETLAAFTAGSLEPVAPHDACGGHHGHH